MSGTIGSEHELVGDFSPGRKPVRRPQPVGSNLFIHRRAAGARAHPFIAGRRLDERVDFRTAVPPWKPRPVKPSRSGVAASKKVNRRPCHAKAAASPPTMAGL